MPPEPAGLEAAALAGWVSTAGVRASHGAWGAGVCGNGLSCSTGCWDADLAPLHPLGRLVPTISGCQHERVQLLQRAVGI